MAVGGEVGLVVLHDDEVAVAAQAGTAVHHFAVGSGHYGLAGGAADVNAFFTAAETGEDVAGGGALPSDAGGAAGAAGYGRRRGWGGSSVGRRGWGGRRRRGGARRSSGRQGLRGGGRGVAGGFHTQYLADADVVVGQIVPSAQIVLADAVAQGDVIHGVAAHHGVLGGVHVHRSVRRSVAAAAGRSGTGCGRGIGSGRSSGRRVGGSVGGLGGGRRAVGLRAVGIVVGRGGIAAVVVAVAGTVTRHHRGGWLGEGAGAKKNGEGERKSAEGKQLIHGDAGFLCTGTAQS